MWPLVSVILLSRLRGMQSDRRHRDHPRERQAPSIAQCMRRCAHACPHPFERAGQEPLRAAAARMRLRQRRRERIAAACVSLEHHSIGRSGVHRRRLTLWPLRKRLHAERPTEAAPAAVAAAGAMRGTVGQIRHWRKRHPAAIVSEQADGQQDEQDRRTRRKTHEGQRAWRAEKSDRDRGGVRHEQKRSRETGSRKS